MGTAWRHAVVAVLLAGCAPAWAFLGRADFVPGEHRFSNESLVRGIRVTREQCAAAAPAAVWAQPPSGGAECLRYWHGGLQPGRTPRVLVFFAGDLLAGHTVLDREYEWRSPASMQAAARQEAAQLGVPYVFIARPGTYGSSGEHTQRRRPAESRLISAALDEIRRLHGIDEFVLAGQSGGGHIVASLLTYRNDIACAVPASAVSSPRARWTLKGWPADATGYSDSYEPVEHLAPWRWKSGMRVFVLGDPADSNVPWSTQLPLAERLRTLGARVEVLQGEGAGPERHGLIASAKLVASLCLKGATTPEILERAARGLKG